MKYERYSSQIGFTICEFAAWNGFPLHVYAANDFPGVLNLESFPANYKGYCFSPRPRIAYRWRGKFRATVKKPQSPEHFVQCNLILMTTKRDLFRYY